MKIRAKLIISLGALMFIVIFIGVFGLYSINKLNHQNEIYSSTKIASFKMLAARLSQADFMLLEQEQFKEQAYAFLKESENTLADVKSQMKEAESIAIVESIIQSTKEYEAAFSKLVESKQNDIEGKASFDRSAYQVSARIDSVLDSIEAFYNQNQSDFEEFNRYRQAKLFKDLFNDTRVLVWKYNSRSDANLANQISGNIERLSNMVVALKKIMLGASTIERLTLLAQDLQSYKLLFTQVRVANENLDLLTQQLIASAVNASNQSESLLAKELEIANGVQSKTTGAIIIALVFSVLSAVVLGLWLSKSILVGLKKSMTLADAITKGDLSVVEQTSNNDEFATLINAMNGSAKQLKDIITQVKHALSQLTQSSSDVETAVGQTIDSIQNQKAETESMATAICELSAANEQIVSSAEKASNVSKQAEEEARAGDSIVTNATTAMQDLSHELEQASTVVDKLNQDSTNIADILSVIRSIAEQTNLLALNAAIEAARAGEQGRGFAVVADEVRTLAARTQNSIQEITNIIELIQKGAGDVVVAMENSNTKSVDVVKLTESASKAYASITESVKHVSDINMQVALGASEQAKVTLETSRNVETIKTIADESSSNISHIGVQVDEQVKEANNVNELIKFFRT